MFLDLRGDRYFALSGGLAESFAALLDGAADRKGLEGLRERGILVDGSGEPVQSHAIETPRFSVLDRSKASSVSPAGILSLGWGFTVMRARLKRSGIAGPAAELALARRTATPAHGDASLVAGARAYEQLCLLRGAHNLCLPHSLALALSLARQGCAAEVVLGVQLGPFIAHCWVECQGELVNDRFDRVRSYTPIRRL